MTLVERFIEIDHGPVQGKVTIIGGGGFLLVLAMWPFAHATAVGFAVVCHGRVEKPKWRARHSKVSVLMWRG
jgi:hypothetical protein